MRFRLLAVAAVLAPALAYAGPTYLPDIRRLIAATASSLSMQSGVVASKSETPPAPATRQHASIYGVESEAPGGSKQPTPDPINAPSLAGMPPIASNFDVNLGLQSAWGHGKVPDSAKPDVVGAFRFICRPGQLAQVDPIVNFGPRGTPSHHLHQFFGNTRVYSDSTYASLRAEGGSTCNEIGDPFAPGAVALNRSAYWIPAMLDGRGNVVRPDFVSVYYKRRPASDPIVSDPRHPQYQGKAVDLPNGLRFIFGRDMTNLKAPATGGFHFLCDAGPAGASYSTFGEAAAICLAAVKGGKKDARIAAVGDAPPCWDGKRLDSRNHRDHMAYPGYGGWGYLKCPSSHPYVIPSFTLGTWYTADENLASWHFSSDEMTGQAAGSTYHADFFAAWDPIAHRMFHDNAINKLLNASGGDLGNGRQLRGAAEAPRADPRLVPRPSSQHDH